MLAKIDPPIHAPKRRSTEPFAAINFSRVLDGARCAKSRFKRSGKPYKTQKKHRLKKFVRILRCLTDVMDRLPVIMYFHP